MSLEILLVDRLVAMFALIFEIAQCLAGNPFREESKVIEQIALTSLCFKGLLDLLTEPVDVFVWHNSLPMKEQQTLLYTLNHNLLIVDAKVVWPLTIAILLNGLMFGLIFEPLLKGCFQVFDLSSHVQNLCCLIWMLTILELSDCSLSLLEVPVQ